VRNRSGAVFAQANWEFIDGWRLTGGARYSSDRREIISLNTNAGVCIVPAPSVQSTPPGASQCPRAFEKTFSKPSWLASVDHQFTPDILGYAKASRGYRTGGFNYRGANEQETFASFKPESVTEYEVGAKTELFDRHLRFNVAAYHDDYSDIQRSITVPTSGGAPATIVTNAAKARINGSRKIAILRCRLDGRRATQRRALRDAGELHDQAASLVLRIVTPERRSDSRAEMGLESGTKVGWRYFSMVASPSLPHRCFLSWLFRYRSCSRPGYRVEPTRCSPSWLLRPVERSGR
jgi:hypothetical protein